MPKQSSQEKALTPKKKVAFHRNAFVAVLCDTPDRFWIGKLQSEVTEAQLSSRDIVRIVWYDRIPNKKNEYTLFGDGTILVASIMCPVRLTFLGQNVYELTKYSRKVVKKHLEYVGTNYDVAESDQELEKRLKKEMQMKTRPESHKKSRLKRLVRQRANSGSSDSSLILPTVDDVPKKKKAKHDQSVEILEKNNPPQNIANDPLQEKGELESPELPGTDEAELSEASIEDKQLPEVEVIEKNTSDIDNASIDITTTDVAELPKPDKPQASLPIITISDAESRQTSPRALVPGNSSTTKKNEPEWLIEYYSPESVDQNCLARVAVDFIKQGRGDLVEKLFAEHKDTAGDWFLQHFRVDSPKCIIDYALESKATDLIRTVIRLGRQVQSFSRRPKTSVPLSQELPSAASLGEAKVEALARVENMDLNSFNALMGIGWIDLETSPIVKALRTGNRELAHFLVNSAMQRDIGRFQKLHVDTLRPDYIRLSPPTNAFATTSDFVSTIDQLTPFHMAAINPDARYLRQLNQIAFSKAFELLDASNWSVIHYAAISHGNQCLEYILEGQMHMMKLRTVDGKTPLMLAARLGREKNVRSMMMSCVGSASDLILDQDQTGFSALAYACDNGHTSIVAIFAKYVNLRKIYPDGVNPSISLLSLCARNGHLGCAKELIQLNGLHILQQFDPTDHRTPFLHAVANGYVNIAEYFIQVFREELGAVGTSQLLAQKDVYGNCALHYAAGFGWVKCLKFLLDLPEIITRPFNNKKETPEELAKASMNADCLQLLSKSAEDRASTPTTPNASCVVNSRELLQKIVDTASYDDLLTLMTTSSVDCNARDGNGDTALYILAGQSKSRAEYAVKVGALLIDHQADPNCVSESTGQTPLMFALKCENYEFIKLLMEKSCIDYGTRDKDGQNVLHYLRYALFSTDGVHCALEVIKRAVSQSKYIFRAVDKYGYTPVLFLAYEFSRRANRPELMVKQILAANQIVINLAKSDLEASAVATVTGQTYRGFTLFHFIARMQNDFCLLRLLLRMFASKNVATTAINLAEEISSRRTLHLAVEAGNSGNVAALLKAGADPNAIFNASEGNTPLHKAVADKQVDIVQALLDSNASINVLNIRHLSPLHVALKKGCLCLLDPSEVTKHAEWYALNEPMKRRYPPAIEDRLENAYQRCLTHRESGSNPTSNIVPIKSADGFIEVDVHLMLHRDPRDGSTFPVTRKVEDTRTVLDILLENSALLPDECTALGQTALHLACRTNNWRAVNRLVALNANLNAVDTNCSTPLSLAVAAAIDSAEPPHVITTLLRNGANPFILDAFDRNVFHVLFWKANEPMQFEKGTVYDPVVLLTTLFLGPEVGRNLSLPDKAGSTPLHYAVRTGAFSCIQLICRRRVNLDLKDREGNTALAIAVRLERYSIAQYLLDKGAKFMISIVMPPKKPEPLFAIVCRRKLHKFCLMLVDYGFPRHTAMHLAGCHRNVELLDMLVEATQERDLLCKSNETNLLHRLCYAATTWSDATKRIAIRLLKANIDVNAPDSAGFLPIHFAASMGILPLCQLLVKFGSKLDSEADSKTTPIHCAAKYGHTRIVSWLLEQGVTSASRPVVSNLDALQLYIENIAEKVATEEHTYSAIALTSILVKEAGCSLLRRYVSKSPCTEVATPPYNVNVMTRVRLSPNFNTLRPLFQWMVDYSNNTSTPRSVPPTPNQVTLATPDGSSSLLGEAQPSIATGLGTFLP